MTHFNHEPHSIFQRFDLSSPKVQQFTTINFSSKAIDKETQKAARYATNQESLSAK